MKSERYSPTLILALLLLFALLRIQLGYNWMQHFLKLFLLDLAIVHCWHWPLLIQLVESALYNFIHLALILFTDL